jgi:hypothetical protein
MADKKRYLIENSYLKGYSAFEPTPLSSSNYPIRTGSLGITTDPRNANVLQEVSSKLSAGLKHVELEAITPEFFDSVPKQQLEEVRRLSKLTGVDVSVHGPVIDTSGLDPRGGGFSEAGRELAEKKVFQTLERSHEINPKGNIPVNFHSAEGIQGSQFGPKTTPQGEKIYKRIIAVNRESGRMIPLEEEKRFYPDMKELRPGVKEKIEQGLVKPQQIIEEPKRYYQEIPLEKGKTYTPTENLEMANSSEWDNSIHQIFFNKERADELLEKNRLQFEPFLKDYNAKRVDTNQLTPSQHKIYQKLKATEAYLDDVHKQANALFSKAYEFGDEQQKRELLELSKEFKAKLEKDPSVFGTSSAMQDLLLKLDDPRITPKMYVPIEEFALDKSSKTYGNAAFEAYKKFGDTSPILTIENPPAGFALSTGEDIKNIVEASRKQFVERAVEEKRMSEGEAKKQAEKLIGATWDVGHINMLRKFGYSEKDIVEESRKVAPFVKHVHLSDNFGFDHTELPMGMGNVPFKEIMEKLGKKGFEARKIIEAGQWWTHFKTSPVLASLETMGSPIYSSRVAPYWNQNIGFQQDYYGGIGPSFPQINYETFGGGFSQLPTELGGQRPGGKGSRMSGTPME